MRAFMTVGWHGNDDAAPGESAQYSTIDIVEDAPMGQAELTFCSLSCLRQWFGSTIDVLERSITPRTPKRGRVGKST
jgi:hypothetical protein